VREIHWYFSLLLIRALLKRIHVSLYIWKPACTNVHVGVIHLQVPTPYHQHSGKLSTAMNRMAIAPYLDARYICEQCSEAQCSEAWQSFIDAIVTRLIVGEYLLHDDLAGANNIGLGQH
jgi:hypothetical protein